MTARLVAVLWLCPALALAAERRVAVHPMEVETKRDGDQMAEAFEAELALQGVVLVGHDVTAAVLSKQKGKVCPAKGREACLAQLCKKTKADVALWTSFQPDKPAYTFDAMLVRCDGKVERTLKAQEYEKEKKMLRLQGVRNVLKRFVADLALGPEGAAPVAAAPTEPAAATKPGPAAASPSQPAPATQVAPQPAARPAEVIPDVVAEPTPAERPSRTNGLRIASYAVGGAGVATMAVGGVMALLASGEAGQLTVDPNGNIPRSQLDARKGADAKATTGAVLAGVGAGLAAAGVAMFFISGSDTGLAMAPTPGGAVLVIGGTLP